MSNNFIVNVEAAIHTNDQFLLIKRSEKEAHAGGLYSLVGGKVDFQESALNVLEDNLKREVFEEIGLTLEGDLRYVHSTTFMAGDVQVLNVVFLCTRFTGTPYIKSPDEIEEIKWMTYKKIQECDSIPSWTKSSVVLTGKLI